MSKNDYTNFISPVLDILKAKSELFDITNIFPLDSDPRISSAEIPGDTNYKYVYFYYPKDFERDEVSGYKLKDAIGFVQILQVFKIPNFKKPKPDNLVYYTYKYITDRRTYIWQANNKDMEDMLYYNFRYDKDLIHSNAEPTYHLQVLHSHPLFITEEISISDFINQVKLTCFEYSTVVGKPTTNLDAFFN